MRAWHATIPMLAAMFLIPNSFVTVVSPVSHEKIEKKGEL
jgi:hypothetical protein